MTANNSAYQTASEITESIKAFADDVRATTPLVHCITNYVTVESCANAVLAVGASPIMSDEPADVVDITSICNALVLNIGTLNMQTIAGMKAAGARAAELEHAIVLDPVGAGASALRTQTAGELLDSLPVALVRGNMSEVKALAGQAAATQGVDVNPADAVTSEEDIAEAAAFARDFAARPTAPLLSPAPSTSSPMRTAHLPCVTDLRFKAASRVRAACFLPSPAHIWRVRTATPLKPPLPRWCIWALPARPRRRA